MNFTVNNGKWRKLHQKETLRFHLNKVQNQAKLIYGDKEQNSNYLGGNTIIRQASELWLMFYFVIWMVAPVAGSWAWTAPGWSSMCLSAYSDLVQHAFYLFIFYLFIFGHAVRHAGSLFPDQGLNLCPPQWNRGVLTTGPPGKSQ